jgi:hypothetical protein
MENNELRVTRGDRIGALTAIEKLKKPLFNLIKTYPTHLSWGIIETYFKGDLEEKVIKILDEDGIIKRIPIKEVKKKIKEMTPEELKTLPEGEKRLIWYRFTPRGIEFIISLMNLDSSQKMEGYSKKILGYTKVIKILTWIIGVATILNLIFVGIYLFILTPLT